MDPTDLPSVFAVTADGGAGLSRAQARSARLTTPSRGVRVARIVADQPRTKDTAALLGCRDDAVLSDVSAAAAWGLPLPPWIGLNQDADRVVAVPTGSNRPRRAGVRGRRLDLPETHIVETDDGRRASPARTWLDCAALIPPGYVVAMGDAVLHRGLTDEYELERMVRWGRGRRGVAVARAALGLLDARAASPGESLARYELVAGGVRPPECNVDIVVDGEWLARGDMVWRAERVVLEYDGLVHLDERQRRSDAARRNLLQDAGWLVIVVTANDLRKPWELVNLVQRTLEARRPA